MSGQPPPRSPIATKVLLHMVSNFADLAGEAHDLTSTFRARLPRRDRDRQACRWARENVGPLLERLLRHPKCTAQNIVPRGPGRCARSASEADIVILTNIGDEYQAGAWSSSKPSTSATACSATRGKGRPVRELIEEMRPSVVVFVDDLPVHHESVASTRPKYGGSTWWRNLGSPRIRPLPRTPTHGSTTG
jgi:hypothetical protein